MGMNAKMVRGLKSNTGAFCGGKRNENAHTHKVVKITFFFLIGSSVRGLKKIQPVSGPG